MNTQLAELNSNTALQIFTGDTGLDAYVQQVKDEVNNFEHDLSTAASRARTISLANKVSKIKVKYDECGKDLVAGWKEKAKKVDAARKKMRDEFDELKVIARKPVTEWEVEQQELAQKKLEQEKAEALAKQIETDHEIGLLMNEKIDRDIQEQKEKTALALKEQEEQRAKELAAHELKLKEDAAAEAKAQAELAAQKAIDDAQAEKQKAIDAKTKADNDLAAANQARINQEWLTYIAEAYQINANLDAKAEQLRLDQINEQRRLNDIENERLAGIQRQQAEQARIDKEAAARAADTKHKSKINNAILTVLLANGISEQDSKTMIKLAVKGLLPQLKINY